LTLDEIEAMGIHETLDILLGRTEMPVTTTQTVNKTAYPQAAVNFSVTTSVVDGTWRVYNAATGGAAPAGITVTYVPGTLTIRHATDVPPGNYWVTVQEGTKLESVRLQLTILGSGARISVRFVGLNQAGDGFIDYAPQVTGDGAIISKADELEITIANFDDFDKVEYRLNNRNSIVLDDDVITIEGDGYGVLPGINRLTVIVFRNGFPYSVDLTFMVTN
jgi:hypothetical protein